MFCVVTLVFLNCFVGVIAALDCYTCFSETSIDNCNTTDSCQDGQSCYVDYKSTTSGEVVHMGCLENNNCQVLGAGSIVGREVNGHCQECCSTPLCNRHLCRNTTTPSCADDVSVDCSNLDAQINICSDRQHAVIYCRKFCNLCVAVDGQWSNWSEWSACHVTCGNGTRSRTRSCTNPVPAHGGHYCAGNQSDSDACVMAPCLSAWSSWGPWGQCSVSCDYGMMRRDRTCSYTSLGPYCSGDSVETRLCNLAQCHPSHLPNYCIVSPCQRGTCINGINTYHCICPPGLSGRHCEYVLYPHDCEDIVRFNMGFITGVYDVSLPETRDYKAVFCNMDANGDTWTVFQRRYDGSVDFNASIDSYTQGFGDVHGEFWLGLEAIHQMTSKGKVILKIELESKDGMKVYEEFANFSVSAGPGYTLHTDRGIGTAGDSPLYGFSTNSGYNFSTFDHDNTNACAVNMRSGWWHNACTYTNLNGPYDKISFGLFYYDFRGYETLKRTTMMFKRAEQQ